MNFSSPVSGVYTQFEPSLFVPTSRSSTGPSVTPGSKLSTRCDPVSSRPVSAHPVDSTEQSLESNLQISSSDFTYICPLSFSVLNGAFRLRTLGIAASHTHSSSTASQKSTLVPPDSPGEKAIATRSPTDWNL